MENETNLIKPFKSAFENSKSSEHIKIMMDRIQSSNESIFQLGFIEGMNYARSLMIPDGNDIDNHIQEIIKDDA